MYKYIRIDFFFFLGRAPNIWPEKPVLNTAVDTRQGGDFYGKADTVFYVRNWQKLMLYWSNCPESPSLRITVFRLGYGS